MALEPEFQGSRYRIVHCKAAIASFNAVIIKIGSKQRDQRIRGLIDQYKRLSSGKRLSAQTLVKEGDLPNGKSFKALKKQPIRAYLWLSAKYPDTYFISHYRYKDQKKLSAKDKAKVCANWTRIERGNDDR